MGGENVSYFVAFTAGILTFLSPCILPLIPSFLAYIAGVSFSDMKDAAKKNEVRKKTLSHTLLFILGFSVVFIILGLTATAIGQALSAYQDYIRIAGGVLIIFFGLTLTGILKFGFMEKDHHLNIHAKKASYFGSFLVGVTFAAAWTPCAGPILGSILVMAGTESSAARGALLLTLYSAGVGVPFLIAAFAINSFLEYFNRFKEIMRYVNIVGGIFLIVIGILMATNYLTTISWKLLALFQK